MNLGEEHNASALQTKAWGLRNYGGGLMSQAFMSEAAARIDLLKRWPNNQGLARVVRVTITEDRTQI